VDDTGLRQELLVGIDDNLGNMSLVLDNLVQFTVLRRGTLVLDLEAIDLQKWLPPLLAKWRSTALRLGLNWGEQLVSDPLLVYADAERLAQAMSNLLSNTIHTRQRFRHCDFRQHRHRCRIRIHNWAGLVNVSAFLNRSCERDQALSPGVGLD
jgi:K+-sensing histidine kinase KdpD